MTTTEALGEWGHSTATTPFRCSPRSASWARCTRSPSPTDTARGSWSGTTRHEQLNDARLSKDMLAALATGGGVVAEGLPGPAFARHAQRRPAGSQPTAPARLGRLHAPPRRGAPHASASDGGRPPRRDGRRRTGRGSISSPRSRSRCRSPSSASCSVCPSRIGRPRAGTDRPARPTSTPAEYARAKEHPTPSSRCSKPSWRPSRPTRATTS